MPRQLLACVACLWLAWHVSGVAGTLAAEYIEASSTTCECGHGTAAMCPMHKTPRGRLTCALGFNPALDTTPLLALFGPVGLLAPAVPGMPSLVARAPNLLLALRADRPLNPFVPPPRA